MFEADRRDGAAVTFNPCDNVMRCAMRKILIATTAAAALIAASVAAPQPADAHWRGHGGAVAAGVIGGLAAGALIGAAAGGYYGPGPYYAYAPGPYYYGPPCYWTRERVWMGWGWGWHRVRVCG